MKASERAVVVKVLAKTVRKAREEYEQQIVTLRGEVDELRSMLQESVFSLESATADIKALPVPTSVNVDDLMPEIRRAVQLAVADIPVPKDGASVTADDVLPALLERFNKDIAEMPIPKDGAPGKDGESVTIDDIQPIIESMHSRWELNFERRAIDKLDKALDRIPEPKDGKDADEDAVVKAVLDRIGPSGVDKGEIAQVCADLVAKAVADIPVPKDGKDATETSPEQVFTAVRDYLDQHPIPVPKDGKDAVVMADQVSGAVAEYLEANPIQPPKDGQPATDDQVQKAVAAYIAQNPPADGEDGTSVSVDDVLPALREQLRKAIDALPVPKDGTSVTLDDIKPLIESKCAEWALDWEKRGQVSLQKLADMMPKAKDGRDAFRLEDVELSMGDDGRTVTFAFTAGDERIERSIKGQWPIYREVWKKETGYDTGDCVTFDGSTWMAVKPSKGSRPGQFNSAWKLSVKKGRNGRSS